MNSHEVDPETDVEARMASMCQMAKQGR
jgi:hypothetical protein